MAAMAFAVSVLRICARAGLADVGPVAEGSAAAPASVYLGFGVQDPGWRAGRTRRVYRALAWLT